MRSCTNSTQRSHVPVTQPPPMIPSPTILSMNIIRKSATFLWQGRLGIKKPQMYTEYLACPSAICLKDGSKSVTQLHAMNHKKRRNLLKAILGHLELHSLIYIQPGMCTHIYTHTRTHTHREIYRDTQILCQRWYNI